MPPIADLLKQALEEVVVENQRIEILNLVLEKIGPRFQGNFKELVVAISKIYENISRTAATKTKLTGLINYNEGEESINWELHHLSSVLRAIANGEIDLRTLFFFYDHFDNIRGCSTSCLEEPFGAAQQVQGALHLLFRIGKFRGQGNYDFSRICLNWQKRLGDFKYPITLQALRKKYPFLQPVAFNSQIKLVGNEILGQRFGYHTGVVGEENPIIAECWEKQKLEDVYALCPLPTWQADHSGQELWFNDHTWKEQEIMVEILRDRLSPPGIADIRPATLPELMFMDFSHRLLFGESPFEIGSIRCPHPTDPDKCLLYGDFNDRGAKITEENRPELRHAKVMPLIIFKKDEQTDKTKNP